MKMTDAGLADSLRQIEAAEFKLRGVLPADVREVLLAAAARLAADQQKGGGEAVAWQYKDSDWNVWASIDQENYDRYMAMPQDGSWQVRALYPSPQPSIPAPAQQPAVVGDGPDDIRRSGWAVAVHNDYRLNGEAQTFWLFTKDGLAIKGEGATDAIALQQVREQIAALTPAATPGDADLGAWARRQMQESGPIKTVSGKDVYGLMLPPVGRDAGLDAAIIAALAQKEGNGNG